eukprot:TRINITY_DN60466_c0_g1_i1.p1 TRINITY_DN60466_c0_g1~~TRINITY_DN60466_c0_g1_i1.p1  ORF type:complete len:211 (+),score=60.79 TRINITY_DN60466_c0_g1_i1:80-712(+)
MRPPRGSPLLLLAVLLLCGSAVAAKKKAAPKPDAKPKKKYGAKRYAFLSEMLVEKGMQMCRSAARDQKPRKGFRPRLRCELFVDQVEEFATQAGENIVSALNKTHAQALEVAHWPHHINALKTNLKEIAEWVIKQRAPSEADVMRKLGEKMNQWVLNVVTEQKGENSVANLPASTLRAMREQGINVGLPDDDEEDLDDEEDESKGWEEWE